METVDFLIIGSGFAGATFARLATDAGKKCLVLEKRNHIGGNAYSERREGIDVHLYGAHLFHTNSGQIWDFVNEYGTFNNYHHIVRANVDGFIYPMPINLMTMHQMWDVSTPEQARAMLACQTTLERGIDTVEGWCLANIGVELYEELIEGYTFKQWGRHPSELPASIIKRLPVRFDYREGYFTDKYQGVPTHGYGELFKNILEGIETWVGVDYLVDRHAFSGAKLVWTGPIDALYQHDLGRLDYRSLEFNHQFMPDVDDFQGVGQMNYPQAEVPYTRIIEHHHFNPLPGRTGTMVTHEYPLEFKPGMEPYYPIQDKRNQKLAAEYRERAERDGIICIGRQARYQYQDMDVTIAQAMTTFQKEKETWS